MKRQMIRLTIGVFSFLGLILGCAPGPVYQIKYDYLPPELAEGKGCIQPCENTRIQCEQAVNKEMEQERLKAHQAYQQCLLSQSNTRSPMICNDASQSIKPDYSNSLAAYNRCFQGCGGRVEEKNICIRNCR